MHGPPAHNVSASQYRPDIDGLRAIAVLAVVAYHAFPAAVPGGFVGVDVFFVISGFLITGLIVDGLSDKKFSYLEFYARRIKRIFPALILVLVTCLAIGWLTFLPDEFQMIGRHVFAGAGFWINFTFYREAGYFDPAAIYKPLLHLWSLAIEEQFYLLWPPIIAVAMMLRYRILTVGLVIVGLSFAINLVLMMYSTVAAFYLPWPRAWELLAGGCLTCARPVAWNPRLSTVASIGGLAIILLAVFAFKISTPFPGWRALLPVGGTVLLIAAGPTSGISKTALAHPALVFVGLISYPLYLWHWPLISIPEIVGQSGPLVKLADVALSFALAAATYRFVERPIRRSANTTAIVLLAIMTVVGGTGWLAKREIFKPRANSAALDDILRANADWVSPPEAATPVSFEDQTFWKVGASDELALLIGDSNAEQYFPRAQELVSTGAARLSPVFAFQGACIPVPDVAPVETPTCSEFIAAAFRFAARPEVKTVAVVASWFYADAGERYHFSRAGRSPPMNTEPGRTEAFAALRDRLGELRKLGKRTVVITSIPIGTVFGPKARLQRSLLAGVQIVQPPPVTMADVLKGHEQTDRAVRAAAAGSELVDPAKYLCNPQCRNGDEAGLPIYKDATHLRAGYVRRHAGFIDDIFR